MADLQEVEVAVGVVLQTQGSKGEGDEGAGGSAHSPIAVSAGRVVAGVTGGVDVPVRLRQFTSTHLMMGRSWHGGHGINLL